MTTQGSGNQPTWWEPIQKFLDNKLVGWGIPGIFVAIAADHAKNLRWQEFGRFLGIAFAAWLLIKIGSKILPYFDQFLDWILSQWVPKIWWSLTSNFKGKYFDSLIDHYRDYRTKGLKTQGLILDLDQVFVPLKVAPESLNQVTSNMLLSRSASNSLDIWDFLAKCGKDRTYSRLAIIGPPGSGKTTLLEYLTLVYASNRQRHHHHQAPSLIPVLIYLRDVRNQISSEKPPTLAELINQQRLVKRLKPKPTWFENKLNNGQCLVLLDGLDEVADDEQRQKVSQWVDQQIEAYPTPFIVTSRPFGYRSAPVERVRALVEVQPFTFKEVKQFIKNWYLQNEIKRRLGRNTPAVQMEASQNAKDLISRISNNAPLAAMAVNPLLLTMIATVHKFRGALPGNRLELYAEICDVLLGRRADAKSREDAKGTRTNFTVNQQKAVLQTLALGLMERGTREFKLQLGSQLIQTKLAAVAGQDADGAAFIKQAEDLSGLLVERERGVYEFAHKSLQEYLAATEIKETNRVSLLVANFEDAWWDETIRLYATQSDATELIQAVLNRESLHIYALALAYECMEEAASIEPAVRQELQEILDAGLESNIPEKFMLAAQVKLIRRLRQFVRVDDILQIDNSYITWAEYQRFLDRLEVAEMTASEVSRPVISRKFAPGQANKPAIGISREEAYQFCAWLGTYMPLAATGETTACYRLLTREELNQHPIEADQELAQTGIRLARFWVPTRYAQLANYLAAKQWEKADQETWQMMLQVTNRQSQGYLDLDDIRQFPCEDLQAIDQLWVQLSEGKYGFSVQKQIWLELGGQLEGDLRSVLIRLTEGLPVPIRQSILAWIKMKEEYNNSYFLMGKKVGWSRSSNPKEGYYPQTVAGRRGELFFSSLASRLVNCSSSRL